MGVNRFFTTPITIRRLKTISGNKRALQATATVDVDIRSLDRESRQRLGLVDENIWVAYFSAEGFTLAMGDKVTDSSGKIYKVIEIIPKTYDYGINQHREALLIEYND